MSSTFGRMRATMWLLQMYGCMGAAIFVPGSRYPALHAEGTPSIYVRISARDLGLVDPGRESSAEFIVENRGRAPLRLFEARPS